MLNLHDDCELPRWDQTPDLQIVVNTPSPNDPDMPPPFISDMNILIDEISRLPKQTDPDCGAN